MFWDIWCGAIFGPFFVQMFKNFNLCLLKLQSYWSDVHHVLTRCRSITAAVLRAFWWFVWMQTARSTLIVTVKTSSWWSVVNTHRVTAARPSWTVSRHSLSLSLSLSLAVLFMYHRFTEQWAWSTAYRSQVWNLWQCPAVHAQWTMQLLFYVVPKVCIPYLFI